MVGRQREIKDLNRLYAGNKANLARGYFSLKITPFLIKFIYRFKISGRFAIGRLRKGKIGFCHSDVKGSKDV